MAVITALKAQKKKTRANVFLDGSFACGLEVSTILKNRLKVGSEITITELEKIQEESETERAFDYALGLLDKQLYTKKGIEDKLKQKGYLNSVIEQVLEKLQSYGYINDQEYVKAYIRSVKTKSEKEMTFALLKKGVAKEDILSVIDDNDSDNETIKKVAEKFMRCKENCYENRQKLIGFLYRKGFSLELVKKTVENFGNIEE